MQTEVTMQVVVTIHAADEDDHETKLAKLVSDLEDKGYDVMVEDEDRLDDVYDLMDSEPDEWGDDEW